MLTKEQIHFFLRENKNHSQQEYAINRIGLFGSFAIEENKAESDIDLLVSFEAGAYNLYEKKIALRTFLNQAFKRNIDICSEKYIKPYYKNQTLNRTIYV